MAQLLGLTLLSCFITGILLIPFIDFLYKIKLQRQKQETRDMFNKRTPVFDKFNNWKVGTPIGGGILIILVVVILTLWAYGLLNVEIRLSEIFVILFAFVGFGALGLYDDAKKIVTNKKALFFGLRFRHKFIIQWILAFIIAGVMYFYLGFDFIFIKGFGLAFLGFLYVPLAAFVIVSFVNAVNIADGLDGLATGLLLICLIAFFVITANQLNQPLGIFTSILMGSIAAFLYFNVYRARIWLGDVGALSLGAALAIIGLMTGKIVALGLIGGVFVLEIASSLIQIVSKKFLKKKIFPVAPFHLLLLRLGWDEPKIVVRAWLAGFLFAVLGLYIAFLG